jgi:SPW repeat
MAQYLPAVSFVLGLWLLAAPYALGFTEHVYAFWNSLVVGAVSTLAGILAGYQEWWHPSAKRA